MRLQITLEPLTVGAGGRRVFNVTSYVYRTDNRQLEMTLRGGGKICIELQGSWNMHVKATIAIAHSVEDAVRIHDGSPLVLVN